MLSFLLAFILLSSPLQADSPQIDRQSVERVRGLLGSRFQLHHSSHFTLLSDADKQAAAEFVEAMEDSYRTFYEEAAAIGLRPAPPAQRLVCLLMEDYDDYRDFLKRFEGTDAVWSSGYYSWRTNRTIFFHDRDNPVFQDVRDRIARVQRHIADIRSQIEALAPAETDKRVDLQAKLKQATADLADMQWRLGAAGKLATLSKLRHEITHQLLFNCGIQRRGRHYPFWLAEGLAACFEVCDKHGNAGPRFVNTYRLGTYRQAERAGELLPLSRLIAETPADDEDATRVAGKYAQAWAFVHFLWNHHPKDFARYLTDIDAAGERADHRALLIRRFGNLQNLERESRRHIGSLAVTPPG